MADQMDVVIPIIEQAQKLFRTDLLRVIEAGSVDVDTYHRYLSFQYHLTKGVQRAFLKCAAHPSMSGKRSLRKFLFDFGLEEEPHFKVAELDLRNMNLQPLPCPLDVALWWSYFDEIVETKPFIRLGATCILENLGVGVKNEGREILSSASFLNEKNTRFLEIHFHEVLPHGDQIVGALNAVRLKDQEVKDVIEGANTGAIMYLRLARWALGTDDLTIKDFESLTSFSKVEEGTYELVVDMERQPEPVIVHESIR